MCGSHRGVGGWATVRGESRTLETRSKECESLRSQPRAELPWLSKSFSGRWAAVLLERTVSTAPPPLRPPPAARSVLTLSQQWSWFLRSQKEGKADSRPLFPPCRGQGSLAASLPKNGWVRHLRDLGKHDSETGLPLTYHFGLEGRLDLPVLQFLPVDPPEEGVFTHVPLSLGPATQPLAWMLGHQLEGGRKELMCIVVPTVDDNGLYE